MFNTRACPNCGGGNTLFRNNGSKHSRKCLSCGHVYILDDEYKKYLNLVSQEQHQNTHKDYPS